MYYLRRGERGPDSVSESEARSDFKQMTALVRFDWIPNKDEQYHLKKKNLTAQAFNRQLFFFFGLNYHPEIITDYTV